MHGMGVHACIQEMIRRLMSYCTAQDDFAREQSELQDEKDVKFIQSDVPRDGRASRLPGLCVTRLLFVSSSLKVASYSSATSSVEDRIKRNINSVQRTGASLAKNFVKKHI